MATGPVIYGVQLTLRPFSSQYLSSRYLGWLRDPCVTRYSEQRHHTHTLESCAAYVASFEDGPNLLWAIWDTQRDCHIGNIAVTVDRINGVGDISIMIGDSSVRGRGFGKQAWELVLDYLLHTLSLRKVTGGCMAANTPMVRLMEATGMQPDGCRVNHYLLNDEPVDIVYYARFNST